MIKEELYKEAEEYVSKYQGYGWQPHRGSATFEAMLDCYIHGAEPREKRIAELEKENAELKDDNKVMADNYYKMEQKFYDKLTEAKEILKKYLSIGVGGKITQNYLDVTKQAEQFLNSEVEK